MGSTALQVVSLAAASVGSWGNQKHSLVLQLLAAFHLRWCLTHSTPICPRYEDLDVETFLDWGVKYLKSDNCASYAMDPSVRFAATRDALLRRNADIVYSIEPFSISPDVRQSVKMANLWRVGKDISGDYSAAINRANVADKWAPLAGPGGWNGTQTL